MSEGKQDREIARIRKNARGEEVVISIGEYNGHKLVNARVWVRNDAGQQIPTKSGWSLHAALIPALREALVRAEAEARRLGWLTDGGG